jgi:ABC-type transport system substrate-binding protein
LKKANMFACVFLIVLLAVSAFMAIPVRAEARSDLDVIFYGSDTAAWTALLGNQIDIMEWALTKEQKEAAEANPDIQLAKIMENGLREFDLNNNYTIITYPGVRSATNELKVRQAIARLTDKDYIVREILYYYGIRADQPMPYLSLADWANDTVIGANYPYPYDPEKAADLLIAAGFSDTDHNGWLNYPADWDGAPGADTTQYPLVVCIRSDDVQRKAAGEYLVTQLEVTLASTKIGAGFKTTGLTWEQPRAILSPKVMGNLDYQVYTGGWSLGRYPTYIFSLFNTMFRYSYGSDYVTGFNKDGSVIYPDVDQASYDVWYTPSMEAAMNASKEFCWLHAKYCLNVPLWSATSYWAYRKGLVNVVNEDGYGLENAYTFLTAYRVGGGPIRFGTISGPSRLNILYSQWYFEYAFLDRVYTGMMNVAPYDLKTDQPWVCQDWETGTWVDPQDHLTKTVVTYYIRKDVGMVAPVTGDCYYRSWNAHDFEFTIWYNYAFTNSWQWGSFMDIKYTQIVDNYTMKVYFDDYSYWFYGAPTYPLLGPKEQLLGPLCATNVEEWDQVGTAPYMLTKNVVQVVSATLDGNPLVEGVDYILKAGYALFKHKEFYPLRDLTGHIVVTYWYAVTPGTGFYMHGVPWQTTMWSLGTDYPVSMTTDPPGIGDTIVLKKNPCFFIEIPLIGEIDWVWKWVGTTKPRSGYYKIELFDVVRASGAYCTRGDGLYNNKWFPGADIDAADLCHIGIYDLVTITGKYAKTFGTPPDSYHSWDTAGTHTLPEYKSGFKTTSSSNAKVTAPDASGNFKVEADPPGSHGYAYGTYTATDGSIEKWQVTF